MSLFIIFFILIFLLKGHFVEKQNRKENLLD